MKVGKWDTQRGVGKAARRPAGWGTFAVPMETTGSGKRTTDEGSCRAGKGDVQQEEVEEKR